MKKTRKLLAGVLVLSMLLATIPQQSLYAENSEQTIENETGTSIIKSLTCESVEIMEGTRGYSTTEHNMEMGNYVEYYYYSDLYPTFTVEFTDGTVYRNQQYSVEHNGQFYHMSFFTDQSCYNPWGVGTHTVTAQLGDATAEFSVEIVKCPVVSVTCDSLELIEKTEGYYTTGYDQNNNEIEYYHYLNFQPTFSVTFDDGTTFTNQRYGVTYNGQQYSFNCNTDQSGVNIWGLGDHIVTGNLMGYEVKFTVKIIESPIASIEIDKCEIIEATNGQIQEDYDWETGEYVSYYRYNCSNNVSGKVKFKDGTVIRINSTWFEYNGNSYDIFIQDNQSYKNQWGIGEHTVTASVTGVETIYTVSIVEPPYVSIEVLSVADVVEGRNCTNEGGVAIYEIPTFYYKITNDDGSSFTGYYGEREEYSDGKNEYRTGADEIGVTVSSNQAENPWTVGGDNYFTVTCPGDISTEVKVDMLESQGYSYYEVDGKIHFIGYSKIIDTFEIPSEIEGKPVVVLEGLGESAQFIKNLIIPDTVKVIEEDALHYYWDSALQTISIGGGVEYLHADMFRACNQLENITVSESNAAYTTEDGVLYNKTKKTLVAYPVAKGEEFVIPSFVDDIGIMFSVQYGHINLVYDNTSFVEEDGVIFNADKTKVITCDKDKAGSYIMPDTVTEIGAFAFAGCEKLTSISISNGVTNIAYAAFSNCTALTSVDLPNSLVSIEKCGFSNAMNLEEITLPNTLKSIGEYAFDNVGLKALIIPDSVECIKEYAFAWSDLENITIGKGLSSIGEGVFTGTSIQTINIPNNITTIERYAFSNSLIQTLTIPDNVINIGEYAFNSCEKLNNVTIGEGLKVITRSSFSNCKQLSKVFFENKSVIVDDWAFSYCPIEEINMENVAEFGTYAFTGSKLKSISVPEGVTKVAYAAFLNSGDLAEIEVPDSLISLGGHSFDGTAWREAQATGSVYLEHIFYTYDGTIAEDAEFTFKEGTTVIADNAFEGQKTLKKIVLPNGLLSIGNVAFWKCTNLTEITIPASVEHIGEFAFGQCSNLTAINVAPDNQHYRSVDGVLFSKDGRELIWCPKQTRDTYSVAESVEVIKTGAFGESGEINISIKNKDTEFEYGAIGYQCSHYTGINQTFFKRVYATISCYENSTAYDYAKEKVIPVTFLEEKAVIEEFEKEDFEEHRSEHGHKPPKKDGHVFSGWYEDKECTKPIKGDAPKDGKAYAKFIDKKVMDVKAQISANLTDNDSTNDSTGSIRFVTTVDSLKYVKAGFKINYNGKERIVSSNKVYQRLYAISGNEVLDYRPSEEFSESSSFFKAITITGIGKADFDTEITVTPFWITVDGTTVYGEPVVKTVNQGRTLQDEGTGSDDIIEW